MQQEKKKQKGDNEQNPFRNICFATKITQRSFFIGNKMRDKYGSTTKSLSIWIAAVDK